MDDGYRLIQEKLEEGIDFIATASTQWHAICVDAAIYDINIRLNHKPRGIIIITRYGKDYRISEENFKMDKYADITYVVKGQDNTSTTKRVKSFTQEYALLNSKIKLLRDVNANYMQKTLFLISPVAPDNRLLLYLNEKIVDKYSIVYLVDDGGLGAYMPKNFSNASNEAPADASAFNLLVRKKGLDFDRKVRKSYLPYVTVEKRNLFIKDDDGSLRPSTLTESYKAVLDLRTPEIDYNMEGKCILFITQPYSEFGFIDPDVELKVISSIIDEVKNIGIPILLKPHPRENPDKYKTLTDVEIIPNTFSIEELLPSLNIAGLIGFTSSVLINAAVFYNIRTISLADIICQKTDNPTLLKSAGELKKMSHKFINFTDDLMDLYLWIH